MSAFSSWSTRGGRDIWTVFTLREDRPVFEILKNKPQENDISAVKTNSTGIITVSDPKTGRFLYKIRPGSRRSSIFGVIHGKETEIQVFDNELRIGTNTFRNNTIRGCPVGIMIRGGEIGIGAGLPPEFLALMN